MWAQIQQLEKNLLEINTTINELNAKIKLATPFGSVVAFAGETVPEGWLLCDGQWIWKHDYPELYNAMKPFYRESDTHFQLPDYRGLFLRGVSGKRNDEYADPDCFNRKSCLVNGSNWVGSVQKDAFQAHSHIHKSKQENFHCSIGKGNCGHSWNGEKYANTNPTGGKETRPKNAYVHYIIYSGKRVADR